MPSRRVLITGLSTYWGGRLAQALERRPEIETIVGIDRRPPKVELERTEYVRVADSHSLIRRIVQAAAIDTIVDTRLVVDSSVTDGRRAHENNVIGTLNILAACSGPDSPVRKVVVRSSAHFYGAEQDDPAFFTEEMGRPHEPRTPIERDIVEAEGSIADFAQSNPGTTVTVLRFANGLGPDLRTSHTRLFSLPAVPAILGFDPRYQFIHEDDLANALEHAVVFDLPGIYNAAADGVLVLSEVADLLGKPLAPVLPPWGTGMALSALRRAGLRAGPEVLNQLRFGRALDNRKLKATGFRFRYTTRETILKLRQHQRLHPLLRASQEPYRYEHEVEEFLRWSPSVRRELGPGGDGSGWRPTRTQLAELRRAISAIEAEPRPGSEAGAATGGAAYDDVDARELVALLPSLDVPDLQALREHEAAHRARPEVLEAIDRLLGATAPAPGADA
jgi:UDP-glucose 4-epimerase